MGQTAIISPQIIDSTQIGRDLITAADQAAAQAIIGVTGVDLDADYQWAGFHTFELEAAFEGGIDTTNITSGGNLITTMPAGGQGQYYFGANPIYLMSATEFRPAEALTVATLGSATRRWTNVYSVDGSFSGSLDTEVGGSNRLFNLGSDADVAAGDTEYLDMSWTSNEAIIASKATGAGSLRGLKFDIASAFTVKLNSVNYLLMSSNSVRIGVSGFRSQADGFTDLGSSGSRWKSFWTIDGSFSGNLTSEVGGSYKLYNLGDESATDSEYLETSWDTNTASIWNKATGAGTLRELSVGNADNRFRFTTSGVLCAVNSVTKLNITSNFTYLGSSVAVLPDTDGTIELGRDAARWQNVASVDGDFSGTVTSPAFTSTVGNAVASFEAQSPATLFPRALFKIGSLSAMTNVGLVVAPDVSGTDQKPSQITVLTNPTDVSSSTKGGYFRATSTAVDFIASYGNGNLSDIPMRFLPNGINGAPTFTLLGTDATFDCDVSVDGNLTSEVGGSYKLYNLGDSSATDQEYLETSFDTNIATIGTGVTGAGVVRDLQIKRGGSTLLKLGIQTDIYTDFQPAFTNNVSCGAAARRWYGVYGVRGDFSGLLTTAGFKTAISGTLSTSITLTTSDHTLLCDCQLNYISVNLPTAVGNDGQVFVIKKVDTTANLVTVFASGSETIDGSSFHIINTTNESIHVQAYSGAWFII